MACFDKALAPEWHRVTKCIIDTAMKGRAMNYIHLQYNKQHYN